MEQERSRLEQKDRFLGLSTLELTKIIVAENPQIHRVNFREYHYEPDKPSGDDEVLCSLSREEFLEDEQLQDRINNLREDWNISLDSKVESADGFIRQLPMMDLALRKSPEHLEKTIERLKKIIVPRFGGGFILETNRSYQFFGERLLNPDEWQRFLGFSLITSIVTRTGKGEENIHEIIADYRYIGHSLIRNSTGLRITANGSKKVIPKVVAII